MSIGQRTLCILAAVLAALGAVLLGATTLNPVPPVSSLRGLELLAMSALALLGAFRPVWNAWHEDAEPQD